MAVISTEVKDRLHKKLLGIIKHLEETQAQKKESNAGFNEQIKTAKQKIKTIAQTIETDDLTLLNEIFDSYEIDSMTK